MSKSLVALLTVNFCLGVKGSQLEARGIIVYRRYGVAIICKIRCGGVGDVSRI